MRYLIKDIENRCHYWKNALKTFTGRIEQDHICAGAVLLFLHLNQLHSTDIALDGLGLSW